MIVVLLPLCLVAQSAFSPSELGNPATWEARPSWLSAVAGRYGVEKGDGGLRFWAEGKGKGMKFAAPLAPGIDVNVHPWLVVRYRCRNYDPDVDYLIWLSDASHRGGLYLVTSSHIKADGAWHTIAADLMALGCSQIDTIATQVKCAGESGDVTFAPIQFAEAPPQSADLWLPAQPATGLRADIGPGQPKDWQAEPSWLANPSSDVSVAKTQSGVTFVVRGPGRGMKWSRLLDAPVEGGYVKLRYRARGLATWHDYVVYMASQGGGRAPDEQYVLYLDQLLADGQWHTAVAFCQVRSVKTVAVQVQCAGEEAELEIACLQIWGGRPEQTLAEECPATPGWPDAETIRPAGFHPLPPPTGLTVKQAQAVARLGGWWAGNKITVAGIPFLVGDSAAGSSRAGLEEITYDAPGRWRQLYMLLGASLPSQERPGYNPARPQTVSYPHRFICELRYADGFTEQQMPTSLATREAVVRQGVGAYALSVDSSRALQQLVIRDGHNRGAFVLYAVTASTKPGPADEVTAPRPAPKLKPQTRRSNVCRITYADNKLQADSGAIHLNLDLARGVDLRSLTSDYLPGVSTLVWQGSIFAVRVSDVEVRSAEVQVKGVHLSDDGRRAVIALNFSSRLPLAGTLTIAALRRDELSLGLELSPRQQMEAEPEVRFPLLEGCRTGSVQDTWVFFPRCGAVISNRPMAFSAPHSGAFPLQVMGIFARTGGGLYVRTEYTELAACLYEVSKDRHGTHMAVRYPWWRGEKLTAVIGTNSDDWHGQLTAYDAWRRSWFQPVAPRKDWFRRIFNFRQQFLTFTVPRASGLFDPKTKTFHFDEVIKHDEEAFGGIDYLHLFDWGWSPSHGRCGDYAPWDYLGPPDNFRREIERLQASGLPVGLYIEGRLVSPESSMFKAAEPWQIIDAHGKPIQPFAPDYSICPWVPGWQDHLRSVYARARKQTGAVGYYIDEFGFSSLSCHGAGHGHQVPAFIAEGERQLTQKVREAVGPECAVYTEETPPDVTMQYQDGSFTYAISSVSDDLSPHHLNLTRFAVPDFKTIEIICCDRPLGENIEALRRILFNGEAIWLEGIPEYWFDARSLEFIRRMHHVMRSCEECFTSLSPEALVPTHWEGLYANRFPAADGKRCVWTIYWTGPRTLVGDWLDVPRAAGARYSELWAGRRLTVKRHGSRDTIGGTIHPHEVLVVLQEGTP